MMRFLRNKLLLLLLFSFDKTILDASTTAFYFNFTSKNRDDRLQVEVACASENVSVAFFGRK